MSTFLEGIGLLGIELGVLIALQRSFKEQRLLANGLFASGTGFGMLVMAPLTEALLSLYSVHGTLLIFSGIALNGIVLGLLIFYSLPSNELEIATETTCLNEKDQIDPKKKKTVPNYQGIEQFPEMAKAEINPGQQTKRDWRDLLNNKAYYLFTVGGALGLTTMKTVLGLTTFFLIFHKPFGSHLALLKLVLKYLAPVISCFIPLTCLLDRILL